METLAQNTIFTNVALTPEGGVWWEGMTDEAARGADRLAGQAWTPEIAKETGAKAAHPNARFTAPASQCPTIDPAWEDPKGVPICAIIFGGRRADDDAAGVPGVQLERGRVPGRDHGLGDDGGCGGHGGQGASRPDGDAAVLRLPHGRLLPALDQDAAQLSSMTPRIFGVNWFRKDADGKFLWPGFGENMRVLKWIVERVHGRALGKETPIGWVPRYEDIEWKGLKFSREDFEAAGGSGPRAVEARRSSATRSCSSSCTTICRRR